MNSIDLTQVIDLTQLIVSKKKYIYESINLVCETLCERIQPTRAGILTYRLKICNKPIFSVSINELYIDSILNYNMEIIFLHPILIYKREELKSSIRSITQIDRDTHQRQIGIFINESYSIQIFRTIPLIGGENMFDRLFTHVCEQSKIMIKQNWSSYCNWKGRKEFLSLVEGISTNERTHITHYLFNDLVVREVLEFVSDNETLLDEID